ALAISQLQGTDDLPGRLSALYGRGDQGQGDMGRAATEYADDVAYHRPGWRTDDTNTLGVCGQPDLALAGEQAFAPELFLQRFERQAQGAVAGRLDAVENQLIVATAFEQGHLAAYLDGEAVAQRLANPCSVL